MQQPRLMDITDLATMKGFKLSRAQLWRWVKDGQFPKPILIGNKNYWIESEYDAWVAGKIAERDEVAA